MLSKGLLKVGQSRSFAQGIYERGSQERLEVLYVGGGIIVQDKAIGGLFVIVSFIHVLQAFEANASRIEAALCRPIVSPL